LARALVAVALVTSALAASADAHAYCRTTTQAVPPNYNPVLSGCITEGTPLAWRSMPVTFELNQAASKQVSLEDATPVFAAAFQAWAAAACPTGDAATEPPALSFDLLSPSTTPFVACEAGDEACEQAEGNGPHQIVFRDDDWPYQDSANTIALTTVSFGVDTGEIRAANMEINSFEHVISLDDPPPTGAISLAAIATHEAGHFVGLAHSQKESAVMYAYYDPGMTKLTTDDVDAICDAYPPGTSSPSSGCSCGLAGRPTGAAALSLAGLGLAVAALRRRRSR
jgi:hypothetical protein